MDIDQFISQFLDEKSKEMEGFKGKYSKLRKKRTYPEWKDVYKNWVEEKSTPRILLSDD